jgi:hypothetical protein
MFSSACKAVHLRFLLAVHDRFLSVSLMVVSDVATKRRRQELVEVVPELAHFSACGTPGRNNLVVPCIEEACADCNKFLKNT